MGGRLVSIIDKILDFKKEDIKKYENNLMVAGSNPGINLLKGKGIYVWDIEGGKYIDCTCYHFICLMQRRPNNNIFTGNCTGISEFRSRTIL